MKKKLIFVFIEIILLILAIAFIVASIAMKKHYEKLYNNCTHSTIGKFDKFYERHSFNDIGSYYPIFKYSVKGQDYYCRGSKGAYYTKDIDIKDKTIYYNPDNPNESYTDKKINDIIFNVFKLLGILFLIIGLCLICLKIFIFK